MAVCLFLNLIFINTLSIDYNCNNELVHCITYYFLYDTDLI